MVSPAVVTVNVMVMKQQNPVRKIVKIAPKDMRNGVYEAGTTQAVLTVMVFVMEQLLKMNVVYATVTIPHVLMNVVYPMDPDQM